MLLQIYSNHRENPVLYWASCFFCTHQVDIFHISVEVNGIAYDLGHTACIFICGVLARTLFRFHF